MDQEGNVAVDVDPLAESDDPVRLVVDTQPVDSQDVLLFHKTTYRDVYEQASNRHPGADDVVLVNEHGMVTETTRANLAARVGGSWITPPLGDGCLPGTYRAELVADGTLREESIPVASLSTTAELATISSLRGWRTAVLAQVL